MRNQLLKNEDGGKIEKRGRGYNIIIENNFLIIF